MNAPMAGGLLVNYCYPPSQLFARLLDSRLTLEQVELLGCLPTMPEDHPHCGRVPVDDFPSLRKFMIAANPHEAGWLCARIGFPITCPPFIQTERGSAMDTLPSIACLYTHSVHDPKPALPGSHGELDALTFRTEGRHEDRCIVTASSITGSYMPPTLYDPTFGLELYAQCHTERYTYYESGRPVDVRELDTQVPGIEPKFATTLGWDLDAWNDLPPSDDLRDAQCSALHGIRHVFIEGWLIETDSDAQVWTAVLRHLPNVRSLYINAPSPASLAPLINEPNLLSALRTLWLGYDKDTKADWGFGPRPQYCKSLPSAESEQIGARSQDQVGQSETCWRY
ncbi:hypothetical protein PENSPDRAFT_757931 [Peniophora sp. CONT]|nr:hypothetical protein PENSPDRAFT_757931 [Peniophora sp. CONT]